MRRTKDEAAVTRSRLLSVALPIFSSKGYATATLEDIAQEAGVTRGAVYWHFGGKAELYNSLLREFSERGGRIAAEATAEGGSFKDIIRRTFISLLAAVEDDSDLRAVMEMTMFKTALTPELEAGREEQARASQRLLGEITGAMRRGIDAGELRRDLEPAEMARAFLALQDGAIHLWLSDPGKFSLKRSAGPLADILVAGIERPAQPGSRPEGGR